MNCQETKELLSAYLDGELLIGLRPIASEHVERCPDCARELRSFEKLSQIASAFPSPVPSEHLWDQIEAELNDTLGDEKLFREPISTSRSWRFSSPGWLSAAVVMLVAFVFSWFAYQLRSPESQHTQFTTDFSHYLMEFRRDPDAAQQFLLTNYEHQSWTPDQTLLNIGFRPAVANGPPLEYRIESTNVVKMPCCTCVEAVVLRPDGSKIVIFEHQEVDPKWFGDRTEIVANCKGKQCRVVEVNDQLAASWKHNQRHITTIGLRDLTEISKLVAWSDGDR